MPGTYTAELVRRDETGTTRLGEPQSFTPKVLAAAGVPPVDVEARHAFQREVADLQRRVFGAVSALNASIERVEALAAAIDESGADDDLRSQGRPSAPDSWTSGSDSSGTTPSAPAGKPSFRESATAFNE